MSKSRLEKFLYALYSLDSSDLPNPLSRIEELYKCWVTGEEAPTFEPISRVEKYLMAILGGYDVDELPNPISRVEVLLYKLASGDDNLDDVKSFLSEHEELLAEIIRNGGVGGNIDIEYVLYTLSTKHNTLYNTAEKPVKSAILKGQTLVNLIKGELSSNVVGNYTHPTCYISSTTTLLNSKEYTVIFELYDLNVSNGLIKSFYVGYGRNNKTQILNIGNGIHKVLLSNLGVDGKAIYFFSDILDYDDNGSVKIKNIMILEGDYTNVDIPYFTGMQSVKLPVLTTAGKNLIDINKFVDGFLPDSRPYDTAIPDNFDKTSDYTRVEPNTTYCYSVDTPFDGVQYLRWYFYKEIGAVSDIIPSRKMASGISETTFTTPTDCNYIRICSRGLSLDGATVQLEKSSTPTTHEPFKSNILTVNEEVELRGIGDVKDELNLLTGELTERICEVVLNGSESWKVTNVRTNTILMQINLLDKAMGLSNLIVENLPYRNVYADDIIGFYGGKSTQRVYISINLERLKTHDLSGFKQYLTENPIKVQYELATESVKTVDLSVVNQDGNDTKLSTFNDITHVTLSSEGLIPEAELEVATKNKEDLEVAEKVPEVAANMLGISREQEVINTATNEQSENVDSTMIATTEIYEELL